jgi:putative ABC transport system permease protein
MSLVLIVSIKTGSVSTGWFPPYISPTRNLKIRVFQCHCRLLFKKEVTGLYATAPFVTYGAERIAANDPKNVVQKKQDNIILADENYFKVFAYEWLAGNPKILNEPFKVVLSESKAKQYFHTNNLNSIIGQAVYYNDSVKTTVAGIVKDIQKNTDFVFKDFISYSTIFNSGLRYNMSVDQWGSINSASQFFIKLNKGTSQKQIESQLASLYKKYASNEFMRSTYALQPLNDIHFNATYSAFSERQANKPALYGLLIIAAFLLLLGCINFLNLTTASSIQRAKEIGIRKTIGGTKAQLIIQFLCETVLLTVLAALLSITLMPWLIKLFADFIPPAINMGMLKQANIILFIAGLVIVVSLLAGFYPSIVLSKYNPAVVLKNQLISANGTTRKAWLRITLTVTQFAIAQFFVIAAFAVSKQIHFALNKELGFRKDAILVIQAPWYDDSEQKKQVLLEKIRSLAGIDKALLSGAPPATSGYSAQTMEVDNGKKVIETTVEVKYADPAYFNMYQLKLIAGRNVLPSDTTKEYLVNEAYAKFLGFANPADAVGKMIKRAEVKTPIVGVLADFYAKSLHDPIKPLAYSAAENNYNTFHVMLKKNDESGNSWKTAISSMQHAWQQVYPDEEFSYTFIDDSIAKFYKSEQDISRLLQWSTGLTIFISCLGLLGLVIYTTNLRTKEIGIRKVLGASVQQIVGLLSKDFLKLVAIAFVIAAPMAWWAIYKWLQGFAYKTDVSWWLFAISGLSMLLIAILTLSIQSIRAAMANPVKSLRSE